MWHCHCKTCRPPLHADDTHIECVLCLRKSHADAVLSGTDCSHCKSFSLASLCSRIAFFSERDSTPCALPFSSSQRPVRTPLHNGDSGLCISPGPLERPLLDKARRDLRQSAQKEGCHNRVGEHCAKANRPSVFSPRRSRTST